MSEPDELMDWGTALIWGYGDRGRIARRDCRGLSRSRPL